MNLQFILSGFIVLIITSAGMAEAAFVKYVDRRGKEHYVNTDYTKVPDEYLDQVRDQMSGAQHVSAGIIADDTEQNLNSTIPQTIDVPEPNIQSVEVFISSNCKECERLETLLKANRIKYMHYDVQSTSMGKDFYSTMGNAPLPITRIGDQLIKGNNILAIKNILEGPVQEQNDPAGTNTEKPVDQNEQSNEN